MRVVVDSNVWISALVFGGNPRTVFEQIVVDGYMLLVSEALVVEIRRNLQSKFVSFAPDFEDLLLVLKSRLVVVELGMLQISVCRDDDDNRVLETAVLGQAEVIVSGDNDLLSLKRYRDIVIVTPAVFVARHS